LFRSDVLFYYCLELESREVLFSNPGRYFFQREDRELGRSKGRGRERGKRDYDGGSEGRVREERDTEKDRGGGKSEKGRRTEGERGRTEGEQGIFDPSSLSSSLLPKSWLPGFQGGSNREGIKAREEGGLRESEGRGRTESEGEAREEGLSEGGGTTMEGAREE
jgi:hypothetical protein